MKFIGKSLECRAEGGGRVAVVNPWDYKNGFIIVCAAGRKGKEYEAALRSILVRAIDSGQDKIAVNMSKVFGALTSDDVWPILKTLPETQRRGIRLKLLFPQPNIRLLLERRKVLDRFELYYSEEEMFGGRVAS